MRVSVMINATYTLINACRQSSPGGRRADLCAASGVIPQSRGEAILRQKGKGFWNVSFNLFDRTGGIDLRLAAIRKAFAEQLPAAKIEIRRWSRGQPKEAWLRQDTGLSPLSIVDYYGSPGGHTDFGP